jgi:hypothetical protein
LLNNKTPIPANARISPVCSATRLSPGFLRPLVL